MNKYEAKYRADPVFYAQRQARIRAHRERVRAEQARLGQGRDDDRHGKAQCWRPCAACGKAIGYVSRGRKDKTCGRCRYLRRRGVA